MFAQVQGAADKHPYAALCMCGKMAHSCAVIKKATGFLRLAELLGIYVH